ncbi:transmembrane protein, putative (macronuclear) [Tetrahymena thermophila SB210]|uniref:Transmembrane protein, putative n=1 Tax=Tetrahymena thermophila (strain SB210) TaxID=312017 RepID=I7M7A6_TETTS|nr:transmembrane protein, putative [Tetrahymena thermophila SB210]EAR90868.2 transmembrane protein, putative [Tetrahymena thermophila SB210]|eukprot:XP_001011113.2 transmembrane protein, putative [Tetrahymena thermophila SB210]
MSSKGFFQKIDIFSQRFYFNIGNKDKKKSTCFGGMLSFIVLSVSFSYLAYLLYLYFENKLLPKITQSLEVQSDQFSLQFIESPIQFQLVVNGQTIQEIETQTGKRYLNVILTQQIPQDKGFLVLPLPQIDCGNGYICIDFNKTSQQQKELAFGKHVSLYMINLADCLGEGCASQEEVNQLLLQAFSTFQINLITWQYNSTLQVFQKNIMSEFISFDNLLTTYCQISFTKATTFIQQGLMFQQTERRDLVQNYKRIDRFFSREQFAQKVGLTGYAVISFQLDQTTSTIIYQFPMITEILSQFTSIFNILLIAGFIASLLSQSFIVEDVGDIYLKEYYKTTAADLLNSDKKNQSAKQNQKQLFEQVIELQDQIKAAQFFEEKKQIFNLGLIDRLKLIVQRLKGINQENSAKYLNSNKKNIYNKIMQHAIEQIDIFKIYKDIIKLNMAIKVILTKEQYAALNFCGCRYDGLKTQINNQDQKIKNLQQKNNFIIKNKVQETTVIDKIPDLVNISKNRSQDQEVLDISVPQKNLSEFKFIKQQSIKKKTHPQMHFELYESNLDQQTQSSNFYVKQYNQHKSHFMESIFQNKMSQMQGDDEIKDDHLNSNEDQQEEDNSFCNISNINHLQEMDKLDFDQELLKKQFSQFIQNIKDNKNISQIDINIYNSLINQIQQN